MPADDANIVGTTNANFTFTIDSATIVNVVTAIPNVTLVGPREVSVPVLPAGDSEVELVLVWAPGDTDAIVDVGVVKTGRVKVGPVPGFIPVDTNPFTVTLFGNGV